MEELRQGNGERVEESYPAVPESVPLARQAVVQLAARAGASDEDVDAIRLATSEALTNAVIHAYDGTPGMIHVRVARRHDWLSVTVADDGVGLHPRLDRRGMGLGLALIAEAADEVAIVKRSDGGTELQMHFELGASRSSG